MKLTPYLLLPFMTLVAAIKGDALEDMQCVQWSCNKSLLQNSEREICYCDNKCHFLNDCCQDARVENQNDLAKRLSPFMSCTTNCLISWFKKVKQINSCPVGTRTLSVKHMCESTSTDNFLSISATGKKSHLLYKNIFCAKCHGEDAVIWTLNAKCSDIIPLPFNSSTPLKVIMKYPRCHVTLEPPSFGLARLCLDNIHSSCPDEESSSIRESCENASSGFSVVYKNGQPYKNPSCAKCNGMQTAVCSSDRTITIKECVNLIRLTGSYSLSILYDINAGKGQMTVYTLFNSKKHEYQPAECASNEVFDPFINSCRPIFCPENQVHIHTQCLEPAFWRSTKIQHSKSTHLAENMTSLKCPYIKLNEDEFAMLDDGRLEVNVSRVIHDKSNFILNGSEAYICFDPKLKVSTRHVFVTIRRFDAVEGYVTCIGLIISLVVLIITIVVIICFKNLRNIPGCSVLSLSLCLSVADLIVLIAPYAESNKILCKTFAGAMHYFFLTAFSWMQVIGIDVHSTFSKGLKLVREPKANQNKFTLYSLFAWLSPLFLVAVSVTIDTVWAQSIFAPRYGHRLCWITNTFSLVIFFALPTGVVLVVNIFLFLVTTVSICYAKKTTARNLGIQNTSEFMIHIKLFVVMGLPWCFGFVSAWVNHPVTTYLFIMLNTLQGAFVGTSFICSKKVLNIIRGKFADKYSIRRYSNFQIHQTQSTHI